MNMNLRMQIDSSAVVNYAIQQNKKPVISRIRLHNDSDENLSDAVLSITSVPEELFLPYEDLHLDLVPGKTLLELKDIKLLPSPKYLASLSEKITAALQFTVCKGEETIYTHCQEITALPPWVWHGSGSYPELLAAFVTPNHPMVPMLNKRASEILEKWTGNPGLNGYHANANRVVQTAAAIFEAIKEQNIAYAVAPASFERTGQRIRPLHEVLTGKLGNCMETTVSTYASCLEACGLNPVLIAQEGHIFLGFWLEDRTFAHPVFDDVSLITKRLSEGMLQLVVVECTLMCAGKNCSFEDAQRSAHDSLTSNGLEFGLDVRAARKAGVSPLPIRLENDTYSIQTEPEQSASSDACKPEDFTDIAPDEASEIVYTKQQQWERHLLNLDLRNALLNLRFSSKAVIPLCCGNMAAVTDALVSGEEFTVHSLHSDSLPKSFEELSRYIGDDSEDLSELRLRSPLADADALKRAKELCRLGKASIEEKGANTLFAAVGLLRWYESASHSTPRYAPILLYPIEILRSGSGYKLRARDEEVQLNVTLVEKLKQDFHIPVPAWETLPVQQGGGIDVNKILASLRYAVREQSRWDVIKGVSLGNFSFSQIVLWRDIHENPDVLTQNKIVSSLIAGHLTWDCNDKWFADGTPSQTQSLPIPADASQMFAIESAGKESFVLHGPPGNGKSQTSTGIIATSIGEGKKVLFITEKLAGLSVVQKRLEEIGLSPFCLELHSDKAKKQDVLRHFGKVLELAEASNTENPTIMAKKMELVKENLDSYANALHSVSACGMSLYELITRYEQLQSDIQFAPDDLFPPEEVTGELLSQQEELLERMRSMLKEIGNPAEHALRRITSTNYSQEFKQRINAAVYSYGKALDKAVEAANAFAAAYDLSYATTYVEYESFADLAQQLTNWKEFPLNWAAEPDLTAALQPVKELASAFAGANILRNQLLEQWLPAFLEQPGQYLLTEYQKGVAGNTVARQICLHKFRRKLTPMQKVGIPPERLAPHLIKLCHYQNCVARAEQLMEDNVLLLTSSFGQAPYNWSEILDTIDRAERTAGKMTRAGEDFRLKYAGSEQGSVESMCMKDAWNDLLTKRDNLYAMLDIVPSATGSNWISQETARCQLMADQIDMLKDWTIWNGLCAEARQAGLGSVVDACYSGKEPEKVCTGYRKAVYQSIIGHIIDQQPALSSFAGMVFNDQISSLRRLDKEMIEQAQQDIYNQVLNRVRQTIAAAKKENTALSTLKKAISVNGRGTTLRKLFAQLSDLLFELCPCMLMSPTSVAQYLPMRNELVDLVVFDEASQIPTAKAVGALARGENAVIVGDSNQMPPNSFFSSNTVDEDHLDTEDLESILDDCLSLNIPSTYLRWHYRSRHESLIAFSNNRFYDNKLLTFPSAQDRKSHVHLRIVDGVFDRGKTRENRVEAEAIIEELRRHSQSAERDLSVGVITFNIEQRNLIDDLLQEACRTDENLRIWCEQSQEPLFIKNLENVQGDERDIILFSVGYGPDSGGKVSLNFGPLNRDGGWRRLNVAVSRARWKMIVFSSLLPEQIDLTRTGSQGVQEFRAFLEYAGSGTTPVSRSTRKMLRSPVGIAEDLCARLKAAGYDTVRNVGCSDLRVDVAVVHPVHNDQYILGILLDGISYAAAKTTRDREISQVDMLENLGWHIHRIWTLDWWDNREKEMRRLLKCLESLTDTNTQSA